MPGSQFPELLFDSLLISLAFSHVMRRNQQILYPVNADSIRAPKEGENLAGFGSGLQFDIVDKPSCLDAIDQKLTLLREHPYI
ncbi:hypothetical protein U14_00255 [Candidatus Moduliflexus flocculans]|uniref:Uncharacterized protein n=1 Tax=Candidatus Moduliflexus flocculans TaxID=1499966 RepID=A0A0S6VPK7_9BACT|nr:hypothetical protein U14_00255 [Candidatus Moduliflexus flocculans]